MWKIHCQQWVSAPQEFSRKSQNAQICLFSSDLAGDTGQAD
jgi:hypothetical protein